MMFNRLSLLLGLLLLCGASAAQTQSSLRDAGAIPLSLAGNEDPSETRVYIVQLRGPSAAVHHASLAKASFQRAAPGKQHSRLDKSQPGAKGLRKSAR